jgi:hypothetical protein
VIFDGKRSDQNWPPPACRISNSASLIRLSASGKALCP